MDRLFLEKDVNDCWHFSLVPFEEYTSETPIVSVSLEVDDFLDNVLQTLKEDE